MKNRNHNGRRDGLTLTELLIVISIVVVLAGVVIPLIQPNLQGRDIREGARQLNALIAGIQARAVQTGRPAGLWLERDPQFPDRVYQCAIAEVPPPYAGDTEQARAIVTPLASAQLPQLHPFATYAGEYLLYAAEVPQFDAASSQYLLQHLFQNGNFEEYFGDEIRFNYREPRHPLLFVDQFNGNFRFVFAARSTAIPPLSTPGNVRPVPFQVFRRPERSSAEPLDMPTGTAIDMVRSGWGYENVFPPDVGPLVVMFSPHGNVDRLYSRRDRLVLNSTDSIQLLVGHADQVDVPATEPTTNNLQDSDSVWVSINLRSGRTLTAQNAGTNDLSIPITLSDARSLSLREIGMGGR